MTRAVFIDRDGVLNEDPGFLHRVEDLCFYQGIPEALERLSNSEFRIVIVTNQAGIGRGIYSEDEYLEFENAYLGELRKSSAAIRIDRICYCPHHPTKGLGEYKKLCDCRKPEPGMLRQAEQELGITLQNSYMIGDKRSDIVAGAAVGCTTILVRTGCGGEGGAGCVIAPDHIVADFVEAVDLILETEV